jgi:hypothetical protein
VGMKVEVEELLDPSMEGSKSENFISTDYK